MSAVECHSLALITQLSAYLHVLGDYFLFGSLQTAAAAAAASRLLPIVGLGLEDVHSASHVWWACNVANVISGAVIII